MKRLFLLFICLVAFDSLFAKIRVITFHYNKPKFIELQHKTLQRFMVDDYELIVINDAVTVENELAIQGMCDLYGIACIRFQPEWHYTDPLNQMVRSWLDSNPSIVCPHFANKKPKEVTDELIAKQFSIRHCHLIQYALDRFGYDHDDIVVLLDGDAFLMRDLDLRNKLQKFDIVGMAKEWNRIDYLWVPFVAFDPSKLPNLRDLKFNLTVINNYMHDTGSQTYYYLRDNPTVKCRMLLPERSCEIAKNSLKQLNKMSFSKEEMWLIKELPKEQCFDIGYDRCILHFGASSLEMDGHKTKAMFIDRFIDKIIKR